MTPAAGTEAAGVLTARVVRLDARGCLVHLDVPLPGLSDDGRALWCGVRGTIHLRDRRGQISPLAVGDVVDVIRSSDDRGAVVGIHARTSTLSRPAVGRAHLEHVVAANVDQVLIVGSASDPDFNPGLVDRILAVVEFSDLQGIVVVNKMDLVAREPEVIGTYRALGYGVLGTSARTGVGLEALDATLRGRRTVVCGHSGVGKSSLLNALRPGLGLRVGDVNETTRRGRHTTTAAVWVPYDGGAVVDTAGVREFGLFGIPRRDVPWLFRDLAAVATGCRYPDCLHLEEPGCAVGEAVSSGRVAASRYASYVRIVTALDPV